MTATPEPVSFPFRRTLLVLAALVLLPLGRAAPWAEIPSDLPPDPELRSGVLPNGVRYAVLSHPFPEGRISVRLVVAAGSREERDDERGLAHFIEHMAFRGTRTYPPGTLMPALERLGVAPGPDNTAFTYYDHTSYLLELRNAEPDTLTQALAVFRDFADGITFDADRIDLERAVILNEKSIRNTPQSREEEANRLFLWPTAREARRAPIGLAETVSGFTRQQFVDFYDAWYRPERMAIIVVGDLDADAAVQQVQEAFASLAARAPSQPEPDNLVPDSVADTPIGVYQEPGISGIGVSFEHAAPDPERPDNPARRQEMMNRSLALAMFQLRLRQVALEDTDLMAVPAVALDQPVDDWTLTRFTVAGRIDRWRPLVAKMEQSLRQVLKFGFTKEELRQARASELTLLDEAVSTASTRTAASLAATLESAMLYGQVFVTPETARDALKPAVEAATVEDCNAAFRRLWGEAAPQVFIGTNPGFTDSADDVARVLRDSAQVAVEPPVEPAVEPFAYTDFGPPGTLRREQQDSALGLRLAEFVNGVRLNFKSTEFDRGFVTVAVRVGTGRQSLPVRGLDTFANAAFTAGGLGRHSAADFPALLAGHNVNLAFGVDGDAFLFSARSSREDLLFCLQLISAYLTDAGYRPDMMGDVQSSLSSLYSNLASSPGGAISARAEYILSGGDPRFGLADITDVSQRTYAELKSWLDPQLKRGPVEVSIVGDTTWDAASDAVARTFGALAPRDPRSQEDSRVVTFIPAGSQMDFHFVNNQRQASFALVFPVPDLVDIREERRCDLLAAVLDERLRIALREELGATYTPSVQFVRNEGFEGFDYFILSADVLPDKLQNLVDVMVKQVRDLVENGISADLFARVHETQGRTRENELRTNAYWLFTLLNGVQEHPEKLAAARDRTADYAGITADELLDLARRYFDTDQAFTFTAAPAVTSTAPAATTADPADNGGP